MGLYGRNLQFRQSTRVPRSSETIDLFLDRGKGLLERLPVVGVHGGLELLKNSVAGKPQAFFARFGGSLRGRQASLGLFRGPCLVLLLFYGLAFPAACHYTIIRALGERN